METTGLPGSPTLFLSGVRLGLLELVTICGELDGDIGLPGVASRGEGSGLGACSDGILTKISFRVLAEAIDPTSPSSFTNGASKETLMVFEGTNGVDVSGY